MTPVYYHFTANKLRDGRAIPPIGEWLEFDGTPVPCESGLHASPDAFDALQYAPGNILHQVELGGKIVEHGSPVDKYAAQKRKIIATINAESIMLPFARRVALDVIHLWDAPTVIKEYLETGDESKRAAAWDAAAAAGAAGAARVAAGVAAGDAAWAAAEVAVWAARAAVWAAEAAAWAAKQTLYRGWFNEMVEAEFALQAVRP